MKDAYFERRQVMAKALSENELTIAGSASFGGSSFWMSAPDHIDTENLAAKLKEKGVLIEPGAPFFEGHDGPKNYYRLAYSSIDSATIPKGISIISDAIKNS
jgi:GntR family transcriptional regulator/MocR family aminotransferase